MTKNILLARPHPFIVSEMKPFLEENGFEAVKAERLSDLAALASGASGAIISLAVSSAVSESAEEVFAELRRQQPKMPVLFAALLDYAKMKSSLERLAKVTGVTANVLGVERDSEAHPRLGKPETFLYVSKDDLASSERKALAARMVQRHFG